MSANTLKKRVTKPILVTLDIEVIDAAGEHAKKIGVSRTKFIEFAIKKALEELRMELLK